MQEAQAPFHVGTVIPAIPTLIAEAIQGSGRFSGTVDTTEHFQFIVTDAAGNARLFFEGAIQSATGPSGDFYRCSPVGPARGGRCSQAPDISGIWNVALT